jgi:hypothetical protein
MKIFFIGFIIFLIIDLIEGQIHIYDDYNCDELYKQKNWIEKILSNLMPEIFKEELNLFRKQISQQIYYMCK